MLAWIALELRHIPDLLFCVELLKKLALLPLTDESRTMLREKFSEIDLALASHVLNYADEDLRQLEALPDVLSRLQLIYSSLRIAVLTWGTRKNVVKARLYQRTTLQRMYRNSLRHSSTNPCQRTYAVR